MTSFNSVVSKVDAFTQPLEINFETEKKYGVCFPFLATLLLVGIIAGTTINSLIDLFSYKKITVTRRRQIHSKENLINATIPMIGFRVNYLSFEEFNNNFFYYQRLSTNVVMPETEMSLQPCTPNHWKNISKADYENYNISSYYCPAQPNGFYLASTLEEKGLINYYTGIKPYNWSTLYQEDQSCQIEILLFSQTVMENQQKPFTNELNHYRFNMLYEWANYFMFDYTVTNMKTDYSFFPFGTIKNQKIITVQGVETQLQRIILKPNQSLDNSFTRIFFTCNLYIDIKPTEYERNVGKITDIFSQTGGLFTSLSGVIGVFVFFYYKYKLRLKLAENTFKKSKNAIKPSDYGFMKSLGYGVRGIVKPDENGKFAKECQRIEKNLNEVDSLVHVEVMLKRLEMVEGAFEYSSDKAEFACLSLIERSSMEKFRYKRFRIEYYDYIVQGRSGMTIHDARELYKGLGMGLQDFINRRLKHRMQLLKEKEQIVSEQNQSCENQVPIETGNQIVTNIVIESSPQIQAESFVLFKENKSGLNTLQKVINLFADIKLEAQAIQIAPEYAKIQVSLAKAFYKIREDSRAMLQQRIPIIILHRLLKVIRELWRKSQEKQLKKKQENGGMVENKDEEEEGLKDWEDQFEEGL